MAQTSPSIPVPIPGVSLRIIVKRPSGYRIRMAMLTAVLWLAGRVAPATIEMDVEIKARDALP